MVEVRSRVVPVLAEKCQLKEATKNWRHVKGTTGEEFLVMQELDEQKLRKDLEALKSKRIESLAVVLAHSYS